MPMTDRHPHCIHPLCGCAGTANCKSDPMNAPLPADIKVGHTTFRKGVKLGAFVEAARRWHREAFPEGYNLTDEEKAANLALLQGCVPAGVRLEKVSQALTDWTGECADEHDATCEVCGGSGADSWEQWNPCEACDGEGYRWWE